MKKRLHVAAVAFGFTAALPALAQTDLIWTDAAGLKPASHCQIIETEKVPFRVFVGPVDATIRADGGPSVSLPTGSILRLLEKADTRRNVVIAGVSRNSDTGATQKTTARLRQEALLPESSMSDAADFVFEILDGGPAATVVDGAPLTGSFLEAAMSDNQYLLSRCKTAEGSKDFVIFNVFTPAKHEAIARIGISPDETAIFQAVRTHESDEAEEIVEAREKDKDVPIAPIVPANSSASERRYSLAEMSFDLPLDVAAPQVAAIGSTGATATTKPTITSPKVLKAPTVALAKAPSEVETLSSAPTTPATVVQGNVEYVVCAAAGLSVRNEKLDKVLFTAKQHEAIKPMQSWGSNRKSKTINGTKYTFQKVQFDERASGKNIGWVAENYVKPKADCPSFGKADQADLPVEAAASPSNANVKVSGLTDSKCCTFPTVARPTHSYLEGMRRFRAGRSKGRRLHAACDLYRKNGDRAVAVTHGKVIRAHYYFYQGTYAIEVKHSGGFVVRYGEIKAKVAPGMKLNANVKPGQTVGYIGPVNSGCCLPMLHFELYKGNKKGALSGRGSFGRRSDLLDPTKYLQKWEKKTFGKSY